MKAYGGAQAQLHSFSTKLIDGGECSVSRLDRFISGEGSLDFHWTGGW